MKMIRITKMMGRGASPKLIAVSNRHLCEGDFLEQIERIARGCPHAIILREKDMPQAEYQRLAWACAEICRNYGVQFIAHTFLDAAFNIGVTRIHLSMGDFAAHYRQYGQQDRSLSLSPFAQIGVSVHSVEEAVMAERYGASYVMAGHIFATESKKNTESRGLAFLADVCAAVEIPVYAIGGITQHNACCVIKNGASGIGVMSPLMKPEQPERLMTEYYRGICQTRN
jgi:thiamine-phosphate pyrophosphorylase